MPRITITTAITAFAILNTFLPLVCAFERYVEKIPNANSESFKEKNISAIGHIDGNGGGDRNVFGIAFKKAGFAWTQALCQADSDGDGQTNGQELGDPCCSWVETGNLAYIRGVSHPADPNSKVNPKYFKDIECTKSAAALDKAAEQATTPKTKKVSKTKAPKNDDGSTSGSGSGSSDIIKKPHNNAEENSVRDVHVIHTIMWSIIAVTIFFFTL